MFKMSEKETDVLSQKIAYVFETLVKMHGKDKICKEIIAQANIKDSKDGVRTYYFDKKGSDCIVTHYDFSISFDNIELFLKKPKQFIPGFNFKMRD